jgi:6-phosphogluconolactonase
MKFRKTGQALLAAAVSIGVGLGITSCGESNTIDYLFVTASKNNPGQISVFKVDQESGALTQIPDSPYAFPGRNPVAEVTSPNGANLYVAYHDDSTIVDYNIGSDGKLYPAVTLPSLGTEPQAMAVNPAGTLLFVVYTFQPGSTATDSVPGPGGLVIYPLDASGVPSKTPISNGTTQFWPLEYQPASVNITANGQFAYVVNTNSNTNGSGIVQQGEVQAFSIGSSGALTAINNPATGTPYFEAGVSPTASASDPTSLFLYVTDPVSNQVIAYTIGASGALTAVQSGPFKADVFPDAVTVDLTGTYVYVANYNSNDISAYQINKSTGALTGLSTATFPTKTGPTCVFVEPAFGRYLYTSNFLDNSITGYQLNPQSGILTGNENSPYPSAGQPTCVAAVTHGNHAGEHVQSTSGNGQ